MKSKMRLYIARGEATLGPYLPAEAAALVKGGYLFPDDLAARNGDPAWVALSTLLPVETVVATPVVPPAPETGTASPRQWVWLLAIPVAALLLWLAGGFGRIPPTAARRSPPPLPTVAIVRAPPARVATAPHTPTPVPEEKGGPLNGTIYLAGAGPLEGAEAVQVRAYPLKTLEPYLKQKVTDAQEELARLAPQIAAAEAEKDARIAREKDALHAMFVVDADDPLRQSLEFAHEQAKTAVKNSEDDCRYFLDLRRDATSGDFYFHDLPAPVAAANANPEGDFTLDLPPGGPFAVAACARQGTPAGPKLRYWLVKASVPGDGQKPIVLSDENLTSAAGESSSLVRTAD